MTETTSRPKRDFDAAAARWDANPMRVQLATATYRAIAAAVPLTPTMRALDFGCGTGLLTFLLHPHVANLMLVIVRNDRVQRGSANGGEAV